MKPASLLLTPAPSLFRFVTTQLFQSWQHFGSDILDVDLNSFGKANVRILLFPPHRSFSVSSVQFTEDGTGWDFTCQHGPQECQGNKVQACVLDQVSWNVKVCSTFYFIICSSQGQWPQGICSSDPLHYGLQWPSYSSLQMCHWPRDQDNLWSQDWGLRCLRARREPPSWHRGQDWSPRPWAELRALADIQWCIKYRLKIIMFSLMEYF